MGRKPFWNITTKQYSKRLVERRNYYDARAYCHSKTKNIGNKTCFWDESANVASTKIKLPCDTSLRVQQIHASKCCMYQSFVSFGCLLVWMLSFVSRCYSSKVLSFWGVVVHDGWKSFESQHRRRTCQPELKRRTAGATLPMSSAHMTDCVFGTGLGYKDDLRRSDGAQRKEYDKTFCPSSLLWVILCRVRISVCKNAIYDWKR